MHVHSESKVQLTSWTTLNCSKINVFNSCWKERQHHYIKGNNCVTTILKLNYYYLPCKDNNYSKGRLLYLPYQQWLQEAY